MVVPRIGQKAAEAALWSVVLATQPELCDQGPVALHVLFLEVPKQSPALADHHEQTPPAVMVLLVDLQVFREVIDPLGEQRNLDFR